MGSPLYWASFHSGRRSFFVEARSFATSWNVKSYVLGCGTMIAPGGMNGAAAALGKVDVDGATPPVVAAVVIADERT